MEENAVVTCFLRHGTEILLVRRGEAVGSCRGRWGVVSGYAEGDPGAAARWEIDEKVGLLNAVDLVRSADPLAVEDEDRGIRWQVHPFLFDCDARDVDPNEEIAAHEWVPAPEILARETVPRLWTTYEAVAPTVETVAGDTDHGSAYVALRALEVVRDAAAAAVAGDGSVDAVLETAAALRDARPSMGVVRNRINRVLATADGGPAALRDRATAACERAVTADAEAAAAAADGIGDRVLTLSRSGTVLEALRRADPTAVYVAESRPDCEGVGVAEALAAAGVDVSLLIDAAVGHVVAEAAVDTVLVGADAVLADGTVVNKVGTRLAALAAADAGADCYAVCATDKVVPGTDADLETGPADWVGDAAADVEVLDPTFEAVPARHFSGLVTEVGLLSTDEVAALAADHAELAERAHDRHVPTG